MSPVRLETEVAGLFYILVPFFDRHAIVQKSFVFMSF